MVHIIRQLQLGRRTALSILVSSLLLLVGAFSGAQAATFTINVQGAGCAANAYVAAIVQGPQGPDARSVVTTASAGGVATFTTLFSTNSYQFVASNAGCTPSMRDQFMNPSNMPSTITDGGSKTISLTSGASDATVIMNVKLPATGTFPKLVMGNCNIASNNVQAGYGIASFATATSTITFYNMRTTASTSTYNCGVYSPADNRGGGAPIGSALTAGQVFTIPGLVDLTQTFAPPTSTESNASRTGGQSGTPNLTIFVSSPTTGTAIQGAQLRLKTTPTGNPMQFTMSDPNGVANFYGLMNGATYYVDVIAAGWSGQMNLLFSTASWNVTYSSNVILNPLTNGGTISGSVKMNGAVLPSVWMNCHPDFNAYPGSDSFGGNIPNPGAGDVGGNLPLGTFSFSNMVPGNYDCWVNSPFSQGGTRVGDGSDGIHGTPDDIRLTISTTGVFQVFSATTTGVMISSAVPITVNIAVSTVNLTGTISGTLTFPDNADLTNNPIVIMAWESGVAGSTTAPRGGVAVVQGVGSSQTYTMAVAKGAKYFLQAKGITYGAVDLTGDRSADLTTAASATNMNFTMSKAGSVQVTLTGPDGSRWLPTTQPPQGAPMNWFQTGYCGGWVNANGQNVRAWNGTDVDKTGVVNIAGLPAGTYRIEFNAQGGGCTVANATLDNVVVAVGNVTTVSMNIQNGVAVDIQTGTLPPGLTIPTNLWNTGGLLTGQVIAFRRGTSLGLNQLRAMGENPDPSILANLIYGKFTNMQNQLTTGWIARSGGGSQSAPKVVPGNLTFYLFATRRGDFQGTTSAGPGAEYRTLLGKVNAVVDAAHQTTVSTVFGSSVVAVSIPSSFGSATVTGSVTGTHIFTKDDFLASGGDSSKTFSYIPICAAYDTNGNLLGLADAIPPVMSPAQRQTIDTAQQGGDSTAFLTALNGIKFGYTIPLLPAGTVNVACTTPNYPPVIANVTLAANQTTTFDVDFDKRAGAGGTISGTVTGTASAKLSGATVKIRTKTLNKSQTTDANGAYSFPNLADGIYRMETTYPGYASATDKVVIQNAGPATANFALVASPGSITGTVYASVFPNKVFAGGAKVFAYDDTANAARLSPDAPHWVTQTDANGAYTLSNPIAGNTIKIFAVTDGKFPVGVQATATASAVTAPDIILTAIPPTPTVLYKPKSATTMDLLLLSPKLLASNPTMKCSAGGTYVDATATDFSASVVAQPGNRYEAVNIAPPAASSICRVITDDGIKQQTIDTAINLSTVKEQSNNAIREEAFGGSAEGNSEGQGACIDFPMGSIVMSTGTVPTAQMIRNSTATFTNSQATFSDTYVLQTDANLQLANGKELDITLPLAKGQIPDLRSMRLAQIVNGAAVPVNTSGYCDTLTGRCTFSIKSLANAPSANSIRYASPNPGLRGLAPFVGRSYAFDVRAADVQTGSFVLVGNLAAAAGTTYTGTSLNAYNWPNPFDMSNKTLTTASGAAITSSDGSAIATVFHFDLPAANGGQVIIRIFTVSGELVRVLDQGSLPGGLTYYAAWDGKNMNGAHVASGVYFAVFDVPGLTPKDHVVKLAVVK